MKYILYLLILMIPLTACKKTPKLSVKKELKNTTTAAFEVDSTGVPVDPNINYFPLELDSAKVPFFSKMLFAMYEPVLYDCKMDKESYRFLWLRTVKNPVAIRLEKIKDTVIMYIKVTTGQGGVAPGRLKVSDSKVLTAKEWNEFSELIKQCDFWNMPALDNEKKISGEQWIMEGYKKDDYNLTEIWNPELDDALRKACEYLLNVSGVPTN
ncbi:MAG: hypothetical protein HY959_00365 [Ignavibacteriae bacterium]|nr:hypothetical protein [Ignavibacteriota bacterium]